MYYTEEERDAIINNAVYHALWRKFVMPELIKKEIKNEFRRHRIRTPNRSESPPEVSGDSDGLSSGCETSNQDS